MTEVRVETLINAPAEKIWSVLTDFDDYHEWNPLIPEIHCRKKIGSFVKVKIKIGNMTLPIMAKTTDFTINKRFAWGGPDIKLVNLILNAEHYFEIKKVDKNQCLFIHGERFNGIIPKVLWPLISKLESNYGTMNSALKQEVEQE